MSLSNCSDNSRYTGKRSAGETCLGNKMKGPVDGRKVKVKAKGLVGKPQISGLDIYVNNGFVCQDKSVGRESEF